MSVDPVTFKFIQLLLAEVAGIGLLLAGVYLFIRGVSGKSTLILQGAGLKAKLINGAPGAVVLLVGVVALALSLQSSVERVQRSEVDVEPPNASATLEQWLKNSYRVTAKMTYGELSDTLVGVAPNTRFTSTSVRLSARMTLGALAQRELHAARYWHLLAAINKDQGYFKYASASSDSMLPAGAILQVWRVSQYNGMSVQTRTRVSAASRAAGYDQLLALAQSGADFKSVSNTLTERFKSQELDLTLVTANLTGVRTLRELSLKYYQDPKYWPLIVWSNPGTFRPDTTEDSPVSNEATLLLVTFVGWPR